MPDWWERNNPSSTQSNCSADGGYHGRHQIGSEEIHKFEIEGFSSTAIQDKIRTGYLFFSPWYIQR
jgi:hypothetical protein